MKKNGFTLVELLVAISIIAILSTVGATIYLGIQSKARDSIRKSDLTKLATALELYFQKNSAYVLPQTGDESCTRDTNTFYTDPAIASYMSDNTVPKDPQTQTNYCYISINNGQAFRLFAKLENCTGSGGNLCTDTTYNYSVVSDNITIDSAQ